MMIPTEINVALIILYDEIWSSFYTSMCLLLGYFQLHNVATRHDIYIELTVIIQRNYRDV